MNPFKRLRDGLSRDKERAHGSAVDTLEDDRFPNPGLPPHVHRNADLDPVAAARAARQVSMLFAVSLLGSLLFLVGYFAFDFDQLVLVPFFGQISAQHVLMGLGLALALLGIGIGAVHWAKTLMPDTEVVEERHPLRSHDEDREGVVDTIYEGIESSQINRRPMILTLGGAAVSLFALPPVVATVASLGPLPGNELSTTFWSKGMRLMRDPENTPIKASDVTLGSVFHVLPEGIEDPNKGNPDVPKGLLERKTTAAVILMRLEPEALQNQKSRDWGYNGIVAYSKICTHAGCAVGLYEQQTHHLLCPCHQSTFDLTQDCEVIFGPAKRPLPQLKITVDPQGYLIADQPFMEPVGPSFWERG